MAPEPWFEQPAEDAHVHTPWALRGRRRSRSGRDENFTSAQIRPKGFNPGGVYSLFLDSYSAHPSRSFMYSFLSTFIILPTLPVAPL